MIISILVQFTHFSLLFQISELNVKDGIWSFHPHILGRKTEVSRHIKVKLQVYMIAVNGLGAHYLWLMNLWWLKTCFHGTQGKCNIQVTMLYLPHACLGYSCINLHESENKQLDWLHANCPQVPRWDLNPGLLIFKLA